MRLIQWQPVSPLRQFQREMDRLFNRFDNEPGQTSAGGFPALNVWEEADKIFVEAELPGLKAENLEISITGGNQLTLKGERKQNVPEKALVHREERGFGSFARLLALPFPVNADKVDAKFENGVLTISLSKHDAAKPRKITVKTEA